MALFPRSWSSSLAMLVAVVLGLLSSSVLAQISVEPSNLTPTELFSAIFGVTSGISDLSVQVNGSPDAIGLFKDGQDIGLSMGVVLSSGTAAAAVGPNELASTTSVFDMPGISEMPDSLDVIELIFTFTAEEPVVFGIEYVFASEEYNEYIAYEDPFRFFVNDVNIALANDNGTVSVGNVNCGPTGAGSGPNCEQFINNELGETFLEYDGYTVVMMAKSEVLPVGEHTIKFAIGDQTDYSYDSAVFIEGNAVIVPVDDFTDDLFDDDVTASVLSDPHIQGFYNQHFEFTGQVGSVYAFISAPGLQMNALVRDAYTTGVSATTSMGFEDSDLMMQPFYKKGTWVTDVGLVFKTADGSGLRKIAVHAMTDEDSTHSGPANAFDLAFGSVVVDEDTPITRVGEYDLAQGLTLEVSNSKSFSRVTVTSTKPAFSIDIDIVSPPWKETEIGGDVEYAMLWHLNFHVTQIKFQSKARMHGVLGQTMDPATVIYQGEESDYLVADGLLGHSFKYDKFDIATKGTYGGVVERSIEKPSHGASAKHGVDVPKITYDELVAILSLDMSMDALLETSNDVIANVFHTNSDALGNILNNFSLASTAALIESRTISSEEAVRGFLQEFVQQLALTGHTSDEDYIAVRDTVQRLQVSLNTI